MMSKSPTWTVLAQFSGSFGFTPGPTNHFAALAALVAALIACASILTQFRRRDALNIQRYQWETGVSGTAKKRWMWDSLNLLREGYFKFYNKPWQVWTSEGYQVVLPPPYLDELKMLPDHTFPSSLPDFMLPQYTFKPYQGWQLGYVNQVILHDLNKHMAKIFPAIREEVDLASSIELPTTTEWTEIDISAQILLLTCRVSGRAFVGTGLNRSEEWIHISYNFTRDLFLAALKLRALPSFLRPIAAPLISELRRVYQHNNRARALIQPILEQRAKEETTPGYVKPSDTIQWIHDLIPEENKKDYYFQGALQLALMGVSVQSTSKLIVTIILNLMKYAEYVPILEEEVRTTLHGCEGEWTLESMARLEKLDSFMRESMRFEPPLTATFQRRTRKPVKLSDGTALPQDTLVLAPADAIAFDPNYYPDPETFDGLRFYKLRQLADEKTKVRHQFVATSKTQVQFGLGRHACPGRWFAGHVIKLVIASILLHYDLKFRDGEAKAKTFLFQTTNMPAPKTTLLMRRKKGQA
ncbi:cytochrome P450 [Xylariales sp. PMI_506]|nr:cytochrome P450 [Xylariales sp. PMI_506]